MNVKPALDRAQSYAAVRTGQTRVRVYRYGLLAPREPLEALLEEGRKLTKLWNALVEVGEASRAEWETVAALDPSLKAARSGELELSSALEKILGEWRDLRAKSPRSQELAVARKRVADARRTLLEGRQVARQAARQVAQRQRPLLDELTRTREKTVADLAKQFKSEGLPWAAAEVLVKRWRSAWIQALLGRKHFPKPKRSEDPAIPHVFRYTKGGTPFARLSSPRATVVRLLVPAPPVPAEGLSGARLTRWTRKHGRGSLAVRIGGQRYSFGLVLHRWPPQEARVKRLEIARTLRSHPAIPGTPRWTWALSVTVEEPAETLEAHRFPGSVAALRLGWRMAEGRIRAGVVVEPAGGMRELWLPAKVLARSEEATRLQSEMDRDVECVKSNALEEIAEATSDAVVSSLKSRWHLVRASGLKLLSKRLEEIDRAPTLRAALRDWQRRRLRQLNIRRGLFRHLTRHRLWWWQNEILALCGRFETIAVADPAPGRTIRREAPERELPGPLAAAVRRHQQLVAPHEALKWLQLMALKTSTSIRVVPSALIAGLCSNCLSCGVCGAPVAPEGESAHECARRGRLDAASEVASVFQCEACGINLDRAENAARVLLRLNAEGRVAMKTKRGSQR